MVGLVCGPCGWLFVAASPHHRKKCAQCGASPLVRYPGDSWKAVKALASFPPGDERRAKRLQDLSRALSRFHERQDHRITATRIAVEVSGESPPPPGLVQSIYRRRTESEHKKAKAKRSRRGGSPKAAKKGKAKRRSDDGKMKAVAREIDGKGRAKSSRPFGAGLEKDNAVKRSRRKWLEEHRDD